MAGGKGMVTMDMVIGERPTINVAGVEVPSLVNWKKPPSILDLKNDLEISKSEHDAQVKHIDHWNDLMKVKNAAKPPKVKGRSEVQPKLIRRQAEWRYPALSEPFVGSQNLFDVRPTTFEDVDAARQNGLIINHQFRTKLNKIKLIDDYVRSVVDDGTCIVRVGWKRHEIEVTEEVPVYAHILVQGPQGEQVAAEIQQSLELKQANPRGYFEQLTPEQRAAADYFLESGQVTIAQKTRTEKVKVKKLKENCPTVDVLDPRNFYIDPTCNGEIEKAMFAVVTFETCKAELLKEPERYKNLEFVNWAANTPTTNTDHTTKSEPVHTFRDDMRRKVVAYEYWGFHDINGDGVLVPIVCTWIGDVLIRMEENPFPDGKLPFVMVPYLPVKRELYGETDAELLEDNQRVLGAIMRGVIDLLGRSANGQQGFAKGMLDPLNRRRFENGQDYEFNPNVSPQLGLIEHKYPELPQSAMIMAQLQNQEAEALTGVKSFAGGISGQAYGDVVAGIRGALDAASKREMSILRRLAKGMIDIGNKIIAMNAVFLSDTEVVRITNQEFVTINREDLAGNFDLIVDISTAEIDDAKAQDLGFMLQTLGNNMDPSIMMNILAEIAELKKMPELAEKLRNWKPEVDPMVKRMQEIELRMKELELENMEADTALKRAKAAEATAKAQTTEIEAADTLSGASHARKMEAQQAQSRGNQDLEVTKALLKPKKEGESNPNLEAAVGWNMLSESR